MKRLLLIFACAFIGAAFSPATVSAHWWGHHKKHASDGTTSGKPKKSRFHREKHQRNSADVLYTTGPKSVGWWHQGPGPAGAGS